MRPLCHCNHAGSLSLFLKFILVLSLILFGYWLKCQWGWNISGSQSLSKAIPFKYLQRGTIIAADQPGAVIADSFDSLIVENNWFLWMREAQQVSWRYASAGRGGTKCLALTSKSERDWFHLYTKYVKVRPGEQFQLRGLVQLVGEKPTGALRIAAFDGQKNALSWGYAAATTTVRNRWVELSKKFVIGEKIDYIQMGLAGEGPGDFYFDDVALILEP